MMRNLKSSRPTRKFRLHTLIHSPSSEGMVLHVETVQKGRQCGLKYDMKTKGSIGDLTPQNSNVNRCEKCILELK